MVLILQVAAGVFLGLWSFRYVMTRQPRERVQRDWVKVGISLASGLMFILWWLHIALLPVTTGAH